ncbi:MAG TPA: hypothetical protein VKA60_19720 [Blastocatellia bacterium]|nr:hypothetical protein [Blastocatellia bacterium]
MASNSADILNEVESYRTLEEVMRWALARKPPAEVAEIVTQDEFTHDIVLKAAADVFLVFDTN